MVSASGEIAVRPASIDDAPVIAEIHGESFHRGWSDAEIEALLCQDSVIGLIAQRRRPLGRRWITAGFLVYRVAADEAEILSVAVRASQRGRGIGGRLLDETLRALYRDGVTKLHLEVEDGNRAAVRLYENRGFVRAGERPGYFTQARATPKGALVMSRQVR